MEVKSHTRYARISSIKARQVIRQIQGRNANEALELLNFIPRKSAKVIAKTLKSAIANAENNHNLSSSGLVVSSATVVDGPQFKRFRPASRGSAHPYRKHTCHISVILSPATAN
jgi:large subunit ribosomal protein L22